MWQGVFLISIVLTIFDIGIALQFLGTGANSLSKRRKEFYRAGKESAASAQRICPPGSETHRSGKNAATFLRARQNSACYRGPSNWSALR
jgi:hypothetical protein